MIVAENVIDIEPDTLELGFRFCTWQSHISIGAICLSWAWGPRTCHL